MPIISAKITALASSEAFFEIQLNVVLDTLIQKMYILTRKINVFRGELSNISVAKASLLARIHGQKDEHLLPAFIHCVHQSFCFQN